MAKISKSCSVGGRRRRRYRIRKKISGSDQRPRVSVFRSSKYTYAQVISDQRSHTLASASTREAGLFESASDLAVQFNAVQLKDAGSAPEPAGSAKTVAAARALGLVLGARIKAAGIREVVLDRGGYRYAGRVRAVAEGIRAAGITV